MSGDQLSVQTLPETAHSLAEVVSSLDLGPRERKPTVTNSWLQMNPLGCPCVLLPEILELCFLFLK